MSDQRTITTIEELEELPLETVIRSISGDVYESGDWINTGSTAWETIGAAGTYWHENIQLPAFVLFEPNK